MSLTPTPTPYTLDRLTEASHAISHGRELLVQARSRWEAVLTSTRWASPGGRSFSALVAERIETVSGMITIADEWSAQVAVALSTQEDQS